MDTVNRDIDTQTLTTREVVAVMDYFRNVDVVMSICDFDIVDMTDDIPTDVQELLVARNEARARKEYEIADQLRDELEQK